MNAAELSLARGEAVTADERGPEPPTLGERLPNGSFLVVYGDQDVGEARREEDGHWTLLGDDVFGAER